MSSLELQVSGSEGEEREERERLKLAGVPLRRATKAVSLAAGLNRLEAVEGEDLPDGEEREGRISFLHSKCKIFY